MNKLIDAVRTFLSGVEYFEQEENANYVVTKEDKELLKEAIDTVVTALEKPLPTDEQMKERGNLTFRVMLRQLNCKHEKNNVTMSVKELEHWFETGQHLKEWKEWNTL